MSAHARQPGPTASRPYDASDRVARQRRVRRPHMQEQGTATARRTSPTAVVSQSLPDINWQREPVMTIALASNEEDLPAPPVHVIEAERGHLSCPHAQAGQHG